MAELHIIGEVEQGRDFGGQSYFCVFEIVTGSQWTAVEGHTSGCTHIMRSGDAGVVPWAFPVDAHYTFSSLQGWPKISIQVWQVDGYGRKDLSGYGMAYLPIPTKGGLQEQEVEVATWRPVYWHPSFFMRLYNNLRLLVMGGNPVLRDNSLIHTNEERFKLHTIGGGTVRLKLNIFARGMKQAGMKLNGLEAIHRTVTAVILESPLITATGSSSPTRVGTESTMWGGLHFFIDMDALLTFDKGVRAADLRGKPGRPHQQVLKEVDGTLAAATSYPAAALLLSTLKATGNRVHVFAAWPVARTREIVAAFGWRAFVTDTCACHPLPGQRHYTLASLGCQTADYASSFVVAADPAAWDPVMAAHVVPVEHARTGEVVREYEGVPSACSAAADSMELLAALCRCVTLAEWRVRVPATPVAAASALTAANVFGCCRFFLPAELRTGELVLLLSAHGATLVDVEANATHVLYRSPYADEETEASPNTSSDTDSTLTTTSSSVTSPSDDEDDSTTSSSDSDTSSTSEEGAEDGNATQAEAAVPHAQQSIPTRDPTLTTAAPPSLPAITLPTTSNSAAQLVTRTWVRCCCRAQRLLPVPSPADVIAPRSSGGRLSALRTTGMLLSALLPPMDAKALPWPQFLKICEAHQFSTAPFAGESVSAVYGALVTAFGTVALVRQVSATRKPTVTTTGELPATVLVLCRYERKRDRDAVGDHLKLTASQFAYALELVKRERFAQRCASTGTQTSRPRLAHAAVGTGPLAAPWAPPAGSGDAAAPAAGAEAAVELARPSSGEDPSAPREGGEAADPLASPGVDEEEWKQHLKNVEGKLLKSSGGDRVDGGAPVVSTDEGSGAEAAARPAAAGLFAATSTGEPSSARPPVSVFDPPPLPLSVLAGDSIFRAPPPSVLPTLPAPLEGRAAASIFEQPPPPLPGLGGGRAAPTDSIFPTPDLSFLMNDPQPSSPSATAASAGSTRCVIGVEGLSPGQRRDLFQYLQLLPALSRYSSSATVEDSGGGEGISCRFATPKDALEFAKLGFIDFGGVLHKIRLVPCAQPSPPHATEGGPEPPVAAVGVAPVSRTLAGGEKGRPVASTASVPPAVDPSPASHVATQQPSAGEAPAAGQPRRLESLSRGHAGSSLTAPHVASAATRSRSARASPPPVDGHATSQVCRGGRGHSSRAHRGGVHERGMSARPSSSSPSSASPRHHRGERDPSEGRATARESERKRARDDDHSARSRGTRR